MEKTINHCMRVYMRGQGTELSSEKVSVNSRGDPANWIFIDLFQNVIHISFL